MNPTTKEMYLQDDALEAFDKDFRDWGKYRDLIQHRIPRDSVSSILDVGGGNGRFADNLLDLYPEAQICVLDYADSMLEKNLPNPRKTTQQGSATRLDSLFTDQKFNLISINVLLHHLVATDEASTRDNVLSCLLSARKILAPDGHIVVYEQVYDGVIRRLEPGKLIYGLTGIQSPRFGRVLKRLGANTAGVGVRFRSRREWKGVFAEAGYSLVSESWVVPDKPSMLRKVALNIKSVGSYLFILR